MKLIFKDEVLTSRLRSFISNYWRLSKEVLTDEIQWTWRLNVPQLHNISSVHEKLTIEKYQLNK